MSNPKVFGVFQLYKMSDPRTSQVKMSGPKVSQVKISDPRLVRVADLYLILMI